MTHFALAATRQLLKKMRTGGLQNSPVKRSYILALKTGSVGLLAILPLSLAYAAHPLVSDDTGTQGEAKWQLEMNTDQNKQQSGQDLQRYDVYNTTLTYGISDKNDLAISLPYQWQRPGEQNGQGVQKGMGDTLLEWKWRFYEREGFSLALKPTLVLPTGNQHDNLGNGRTGYGVTAISTFKSGSWTWLGDAGFLYADNSVGSRRPLWSASSAILYQLTKTVQLVADTGIRRNPDPDVTQAPAFVLAGIIYSPSQKIDLDIGYKRGLNHAETDRDLALGITLHW